MKYRVLTFDGQILGHHDTREDALALAFQQAEQLSESIEIKKLNRDPRSFSLASIQQKFGRASWLWYDTWKKTCSPGGLIV